MALTVEEIDKGCANPNEAAPFIIVWEVMSDKPFSAGLSRGGEGGLLHIEAYLHSEEAQHEDLPRRRLELNLIPWNRLRRGWETVDGDSPGHNVYEIGVVKAELGFSILRLAAEVLVCFECSLAEMSVLCERGSPYVVWRGIGSPRVVWCRIGRSRVVWCRIGRSRVVLCGIGSHFETGSFCLRVVQLLSAWKRMVVWVENQSS